MQAELYQLEGKEALAALRAEAEEVAVIVAAFEDWQRKGLPKIGPLVQAGFQLEDAARVARQRLNDHIEGAYAQQAVRDAGA
jgi:hypothetical protein